MRYSHAKREKEHREKLVDTFGERLNLFPKDKMGLTPDSVKFSKEYRLAKRRFDSAFKELQNFNRYFVKTFKKEYAQERNERLRA